MTEPAGTTKPSLDVVLVNVSFAALMLLGMAGWSIWQGLLPYWDVNVLLSRCRCMSAVPLQLHESFGL